MNELKLETYKMICAWCSCGISNNEKYCSQCGGPNPNYHDLYIERVPVFNVGNRVIDYWIELKVFTRFNIPPHGILKRVIVKTSKKLERIEIVLEGSYMLVSVMPETNIFIYNCNVELNQLHDAHIDMRSIVDQKATITLETNE